MNRYGVRRCYVSIERNLRTIAMAWLSRPRPVRRQYPPTAAVAAAPVNPPAAPIATAPVNQPAASVAAALANPPAVQRVFPMKINQTNRLAGRVSVSSCYNLYEVDGEVEEVGFDYLQKHHQDALKNAQVTEGNHGNVQNVENVENDVVDNVDMIDLSTKDNDYDNFAGKLDVCCFSYIFNCTCFNFSFFQHDIFQRMNMYKIHTMRKMISR